MLTEEIIFAAEASSIERPNFADVNALRLRYAALKWLRMIAYAQECDLSGSTTEIDLHVSLPHDAEYVAVWQALAECRGNSLLVHAVEEPSQDAPNPPPNSWWRRWLGRHLAHRSQVSSPLTEKKNRARRILFIGNPRILDGVCDEALAQGGEVAWLYDRFAVGAWLQRRGRVRWLVCDDDRAPTNEVPVRLLQRPVIFRGIDLTSVIEVWHATWRERVGVAQTRQRRAIKEHFSANKFSNLVIDEDATPLARMAIRESSKHEVRSFVIQHGVCGVSFGYVPLAADRFCAWDDGARRQMQWWGVPSDRIVVTGSPSQERFVEGALRRLNGRALSDRSNSAGNVRVLLVAITAPRDERPDSITFHLTTRTYREMLHMACAAVAELPNAELIVKLHPRAPECDPVLSQVLMQFPDLKRRIVVKKPLDQTLVETDCVLSLASTAGLDAAAAGFPVVQLLPRGSGELNPAAWYGLLGTARSLDELRPLLKQAIATPRRAVRSRHDAAERVVGVLHF